MNPRQRRGVLLLMVTLLGAVLTFFAVASYVSSVSSQVGPTTTVVRLAHDVQALDALDASDVEVVEVPVRWVPDGALTSIGQIEGLVTSGAYTSGSVLQEGMLEEPPGLQQGFREVAIMVDAETGVAGKIASGDYVDIIATIEDPETKARSAVVVVQNVQIIDVGVVTDTSGEDADGNFSTSEGIPVTFALSTNEALNLAYAESFAVKLRLSLRGAGDNDPLSGSQSIYTGPDSDETGE